MLDEPVTQHLCQHRAGRRPAVDVQELVLLAGKGRCRGGQHTAPELPALAVLGVNVLQEGCAVLVLLRGWLLEELLQAGVQGAVLQES